MSAEVDGVALSAAQERRFEKLRAAAKAAGAGDEEAVSSAQGSWRILYRVSGGKWERKPIAVTSRGYKFAQRPGEVAVRGPSGVSSAAEETRVSRQLLIERAMLPAGSVRVVQDAAVRKEGEDALPSGVLMRVDAVLGQVDTVNRNNRVYRRELMAREIKAAAKKGGAMKERGMFALADHPQFSFFGGGDPPNGSTTRIAGIQNTAEFAAAASAESPDVVGTIDIIDSENGREIAAVVRAGGSLGISQRGWGTVEEDVFTDAQGRQVVAGVVQDDYHLEAWDFVIGPSADAGVVGFRESAGDGAEDAMDITLENLKLHHPALVAALKAEGAEGERLSVAAAVEAAKAEVSAAAVADKDAAVEAARAAGVSEGKAAAEAALSEDVALSAAVRAAAGTEDPAAWISAASARAVESGKVSALLKVLAEKAGHNSKVYRECAAKAFSADGAPAMEPSALEAAVAEALKSVSTPADAPPRPGAGRVGEDGGEPSPSTEDAEALAEVNRMRSRGGLPPLDKLPSSPASA